MSDVTPVTENPTTQAEAVAQQRALAQATPTVPTIRAAEEVAAVLQESGATE